MAKTDDGFHYDMSQFHPLKVVLEETLGHSTYVRLKETGTLADWKKACLKLLNTTLLARRHTIEIVDDEWVWEFDSTIQDGRRLIPHAKNAADLFAALSATLIRLTFLQLGDQPRVGPQLDRAPPSRDFWRLRAVRTVQYVQSELQKSSQTQRIERRRAALEKCRE